MAVFTEARHDPSGVRSTRGLVKRVDGIGDMDTVTTAIGAILVRDGENIYHFVMRRTQASGAGG
ncbi:hypothetical protein AB5I41_00260 [Sphingomonas sp. MMS24-JH45]